MSTKLLSEADVSARLSLPDALDTVEKTYIEDARGRVINPPKLTMHMGDDGEWPDLNAFSIDMPAYVDWLGVAGTKWAVATWDADSDPISSLILLFDPDRGRFTSIMEGMYLTGVRTALQSVVGIKHLPHATPDSVGVIGAGFQARFQLSALDELTDVSSFRLFDIDGAAARELAAELNPRTDAEIVVRDSVEAVTRSDALLTVTDSKTPVFEGPIDEPDVIVALGSYRELPDGTLLGADHLVVDHVEQCLQRGALADLAARGGLTRDDIHATIGTVLDGGYDRRIASGDRTVFVPIGIGALDIALADSVLRADGASPLGEFDFSRSGRR